MIILFLVMIFTIAVLLGRCYGRFNISRPGWWKITALAVAAFIADCVIEKFIMRQRERNRQFPPDFFR
jgi:hypothetical protein